MRRFLTQIHAALFGAGVTAAIMGNPNAGTALCVLAILVGGVEERIYGEGE